MIYLVWSLIWLCEQGLEHLTYYLAIQGGADWFVWIIIWNWRLIAVLASILAPLRLLARSVRGR